MGDFDLLDALSDSSMFLGKNVNWREILFNDWEISPLQELYFVQQCEKDPAFADAVTNDVTEDLVAYIDFRIRKHANVNLIYVGEPGSGKSTFACMIYLYLRDRYLEMRNIDLGDWILTFDSPSTLDAYSKLDTCRQIFQDEDDDLQGANSRTILDKLGNLIKRVRAWEINLSICCPELTTIPGCQYALVPFGFNKTGAKHFEETGDPSECGARALLYVKDKLRRDKYSLQGCVFMQVGRAITYMQKTGYHEAKKKSFENLKENHGGAGAYTDAQTKDMGKYAKKLIRIAIKHGWDGSSKKALDTYIIYTKTHPSTDELKKIIQIAMDEFKLHKDRYLKKKTAASNATDPNLDLPTGEFDAEKLIPEILTEIKTENTVSDNVERDVEIYANLRLGTKNSTDYIKSLRLSGTRITQIRSTITGEVCRKLGLIYEKYVYKQYLDAKQYDLVEHAGGESEWDIRLTKNNKDGKILSRIYISVKCMEIPRGSQSIYYKKFKPEIEAAQADYKNEIKTLVKAHVYNLWDKKIYEKTLENEIIEQQEIPAKYGKRTFIINP
jgi:ABC-type oligopeptide transport system ATPase subunit